MQYEQGNEILRFIINNGMINLNDVQNSMEAMKKEELLMKHPYKIWERKNGKWYTYFPDKEKGRVLKKRSTIKAIVKYSLTAKAYSNLRTLTIGIFKYAKEKGYINWRISQTVGDMELQKRHFVR